jgi:hypothetical protein
MNNDVLPKLPNQLVGNMGLFYVCYVLSRRGWNCLPTSRNAKGVDLIIYNQDAEKMHTIQVKALSRKNPVPFGQSANLIAEFLIICVLNEIPDIYILSKEEVSITVHRGEKDGRISYWLQPQSYVDHKARWELIGNGLSV